MSTEAEEAALLAQISELRGELNGIDTAISLQIDEHVR
jgi:hypothetical protein